MPFEPEPHLFAILNDPCPDKLCLVVMVTTIYSNRVHDPACLLDAGDHPFIKHPSYVLYRRASLVRASQIITCTAQGLYVPKEDFPPAAYQRIRDGLYDSEETKRAMINYAVAVGI